MFNVIQQGHQTYFYIKKYAERLILTAVKETKAQKFKRYHYSNVIQQGDQTWSTLFNRVAKPV